MKQRQQRGRVCRANAFLQKKAREKSTMKAYFSASRNSDDRESRLPTSQKVGDWRRADLEGEKQVGFSGDMACHVSIDTEMGTSSHASQLKGRSADVVVLHSTPGKVILSSDSSHGTSLDDPQCEPRIPSESEEDENERDRDFVEPDPLIKRLKKNYDFTRKFQMEWSAKLPWAEMVLEDGVLHMVRCKVCTEMGKKSHVMDPKWHTLITLDERVKHK